MFSPSGPMSTGIGTPVGVAEEVTTREAAEANGAPREGTSTPRQDAIQYFYGELRPLSGGTRDNPCNFPDYGSAYEGTYGTYRLIGSHPKVAHVMSQVVNPILINDVAWVAREGTPEPVVQFVRDKIAPLLLPCRTEGIPLGIQYGHYKFEKVWKADEGRWFYDWIKPLAVDGTNIMVEKETGKFAGLRYGTGDQWLTRRYSFLWTYKGEAGNYYGLSRYENIRVWAWRDWLDCATQLQWLAFKIVGKLAVITTPSGEFEDGGNPPTMRKWSEVAMAAGRAISSPMSNGTIWLPTAALPDLNTKENIDLLKIALVNIDVKDFGDQAPAIEGLLNRMRHDEELMSEGLLRSPRTNMESKHGSKADAQQHTDTDLVDSELVNLWFCDAFNQQVVDDALAANWGELMRGAVKAVPAGLRDVAADADYKVIDGMILNPSLSTQALEQVDWKATFDRRGILVKKGAKLDLKATLPDPGATGDEVPPGRGGPNNGGANPKTEPANAAA